MRSVAPLQHEYVQTAHTQFGLLVDRRFGPFYAVLLIAALNDQAFMQALVLALAYRTASFTSLGADLLQNLVQALLVLPLLAFSALAGQLADKYEKAALVRAALLVQLACMALGAAGLLLASLPLLFAALLLGGVQAALLSPVKYAMLPQQLAPSELVGGNGLLVGGTAVAVVAGMLYGGLLAAQPRWGFALLAASTLALSALALALARAIAPAAPPAPGLAVDWNPLRATLQLVRLAVAERAVFAALLGMSWFWFYAVLLATQLPNLASRVLGASEYGATALLAAAALGIGAGALLCERLSGHKVEPGLVPLGALGVTACGLDLAWAAAGGGAWRIGADLALLGVFGGLYAVPLCALVQERAAPGQRSRIIAAGSFLNGAFALLAAAFAIALFEAGATIPQLFLAAALLHGAVTLGICRAVPEIPARFMAWLLVHSAYRVHVSGVERIPQAGPALLVCNHVSYVDAIVITAASPRPIRWVVDHRIYRLPLLRVFFRLTRAIPIARAKEDAQVLARAYEAIAEALRRGEAVGIFPEGRRTTDGELGEFRPGVRRVLERTPVPVVPMALTGLWQSAFSRNGGKLLLAARLSSRVRLAIGEAMDPAGVTPQALRAAVLALRGDRR